MLRPLPRDNANDRGRAREREREPESQKERERETERVREKERERRAWPHALTSHSQSSTESHTYASNTIFKGVKYETKE